MKHCDWFLKFLNIAMKRDGIYVENLKSFELQNPSNLRHDKNPEYKYEI